jgi:arsenate reductase
MAGMPASAPLGFVPCVVPAELVSACRDLAAGYAGVYSAETVLRTAYESYQLMIAAAGRRPDTVAHALRFATDWLADGARVRSRPGGLPAKAGRPTVLFVCAHRSDRAGTAAALLRRRTAGAVAVRLSRDVPPGLLDDAVRAADVVVTLGCGDICPVYAGKRYLDWPFAARLAARVDGLAAELGA